MVIRLAFLLLAFAAPAAAADAKVTEESFSFKDKSRTYFLYVPDTLKADADAPLLILLHGSNRDGRSLVDPWKKLARQEGIILAGPNSLDKAMWDLGNDGPYFVADLVDAIRVKHRVDLRRLYLFGHSGGAIQGLMLGLLESEYFAAVTVHAGVLPTKSDDILALADRKIPIGIWVGTRDPLFPLEAVRATRAALEAAGQTVHFREISNHTHNYYARSGEINAEVWTFLEQHRLSANPKFKEYDLR